MRLLAGIAAGVIASGLILQALGLAHTPTPTRLVAEASALRRAQHQAEVVVPLLMVPLGLLGLVVLWFVLGTAAEQRRPELALTRLRGQGVGGARAQLLAELMPAVIVGVLIGGGGGVAKRLMTLALDATQQEPPASGTSLMADGHVVGHITSAVYSPERDAIIALAYVHRDAAEVGRVLTVDGGAAATIVA